jgi:hypothetical protein
VYRKSIGKLSQPGLPVHILPSPQSTFKAGRPNPDSFALYPETDLLARYTARAYQEAHHSMPAGER